jgi:hypothetical protein
MRGVSLSRRRTPYLKALPKFAGTPVQSESFAVGTLSFETLGVSMNKATIEKKWRQQIDEVTTAAGKVPHSQERDALVKKATTPHVSEWLSSLIGCAASDKQCIHVWYAFASFFWPAAILLTVLVGTVLNLSRQTGK